MTPHKDYCLAPCPRPLRLLPPLPVPPTPSRSATPMPPASTSAKPSTGSPYRPASAPCSHLPKA